MDSLDGALLDAADQLDAADRGGILRALATAGAQIRESTQLAAESGIGRYLAGERPRAVLLVADPPAADVLAALAALAAGLSAAAPVTVHTEPALPLWLGPADLMLVAAHTGAAERTLTLVEAAARRGVSVVAVGPAGSPLAAACGGGRLPYVPLPAGRQSRAAFWGLLTPLLLAAAEAGAADVDPSDLAAAADHLDGTAERCRPANETFVNPAKSLALDLGLAVPVLWGTSPLAGAAAFRAAAQLAGTAAHPALWGVLPDVADLFGGVFDGHQPEVADLFRDRVDDVLPRRPRLVLLRDVTEAPDVQTVVEGLIEDLADRGTPVTELAADDAGPVTRLASLVGLLDYAAVYTGLALGVDPSGVRTGALSPSGAAG